MLYKSRYLLGNFLIQCCKLVETVQICGDHLLIMTDPEVLAMVAEGTMGELSPEVEKSTLLTHFSFLKDLETIVRY